MNASIKIVRINIDERWSDEEMEKILHHLEELYNLRLILQIIHEDWLNWEHFYRELTELRIRKWRMLHPALIARFYSTVPSFPLEPNDLLRLSSNLYPHEHLDVRRIQYGSDGFGDLAGFGEIVGFIKDFILAIIEKISSHQKSTLENEKDILKNHRLRIENARRFVQPAKECGYSETALRDLIHWVDDRQDLFINLVNNGIIRSVEIVSEEDEKETG